jgi:hypothetical protein
LLCLGVRGFSLYLIFWMPQVNTYTQELSEQDANINNITKKFVPIQQSFVQSNKGLQQALSCADRSYQSVMSQASHDQLSPVLADCKVVMSWYDANMIKSSIAIAIMNGYYNYQIEYQNKYYSIVM